MRTPRPARQTGRMRALSRRDVTACELTSGLEPGELVERVPGELTRDCRDEHQDCNEGNQLRLPLQHPQNLPEQRRQTGGLFLLRSEWRIPPKGDLGKYRFYAEETRPASASGRRPHAKRFSYQPERVATATP